MTTVNSPKNQLKTINGQCPLNTMLKGERFLIGNMWYTVIDTILALHSNCNVAVTHYLVIDENDHVTTVLPSLIEVWERPLSHRGGKMLNN